MNNLFEHTLENVDTAVQTLAVENLHWLETDLSVDTHTHFFDLFTSSPNIARMYNLLVEDGKGDCHAYIRWKLKGFEDT